MSLERWIKPLQQRENLPREEMRAAFTRIMQGAESEDELAQFLTALHEKGETADEIAGAAEVMRSVMTRLPTQRTVVVDTCGTGGTGSKIFNVSTAAAIVTAAAGIAVAKHGNRSVTSVSGSSDVLTALGVNILAPIEVLSRCLDELGLCFCFAPQFHPAMKHVAGVRKKLGIRTIFNLLGPLCNPAGAQYQVMGVGRPELRPLLAHALQQLKTTRSVVVGGASQAGEPCGELSLASATHAIEVSADRLREMVWSPGDFGLPQAGLEALQIDSPAASAALIQRILAGEKGPPRDMVVLNAAAAIWVATPDLSPAAAAAQAGEAIDSGRASELLAKFAKMTSSP
jgi:anthranilate phosphoribosyltransferase